MQSGDLDREEVTSRIRAGNVHINGASPGMDVPLAVTSSRVMAASGCTRLTNYRQIKAISGFELPDHRLYRGCRESGLAIDQGTTGTRLR